MIVPSLTLRHHSFRVFLCTSSILGGIKDAEQSCSEAIKDLISNGRFSDALTLYRKLHSSGFHGNVFILPSVLKACASLQSLRFGLQLHCNVLKNGHDFEIATGNSLITMYAKCSFPDSAFQVFNTMSARDVISWNAMISCYAQNGNCVQAIQLFYQMSELDMEPNTVTWSVAMAAHAREGHVLDVLELFKRYLASGLRPSFDITSNILSVSSQTCNLKLGRETHASIVRNESHQTVFSATALIDMYSKCYDLNASFKLFEQISFKNEVSWTAMITGCLINKCPVLSLDLFCQMQVAGIKLNRVTLVAVIPACAALGDVGKGKEIHGFLVRQGFGTDQLAMGALLDMYSKCGHLRLAEIVFRNLESPDVVVWSSLINGYSYNGDDIRAMGLFVQMQRCGVLPNYVTIIAVLSACSNLSALHQGRSIHGCLIKSGIGSHVYVCNLLIDMYAKSGCLEASHLVFHGMLKRDSVSWSCLLYAYGLHGYGKRALELFESMQEAGFRPDPIAFLSVLSACKHTGLVDEGIELFTVMVRDHQIVPRMEHYSCFIDLLAKSGRLIEAFKIMRHLMPEPYPSAWSSLTSACRLHGEIELAEQLSVEVLEAEPDNAANYALLSTLHAESGNRPGAEELWRLMKMGGLKKSPACTWIENTCHELSAGGSL